MDIRRWLRRPLAAAGVVAFLASAYWLTVASSPGLGPSGCPSGCATDRDRQAGPLRVVSFNMLHGFPDFTRLDERIELIADELLRVDADIVLLQEVPWTPAFGSVADRLAGLTGSNYLWLRANGNRRAILFEEGEVILSRYPMRAALGVELPKDPDFFQHRVALAATVATPWGDVRVVSAHLSGDPPATSSAEVAALGDWAEAGVVTDGLPMLVGGDFNAHDDQDPIRVLASRPGWVDLAGTATPGGTPPLTCCHDDLTAAPDAPLTERIDYLWAVAGSQVVWVPSEVGRIFDAPFSTDGGWLWASDHVGVYAVLEAVPR